MTNSTLTTTGISDYIGVRNRIIELFEALSKVAYIDSLVGRASRAVT